MSELQRRALEAEIESCTKASEFWDRATPVLDKISGFIDKFSIKYGEQQFGSPFDVLANVLEPKMDIEDAPIGGGNFTNL